MIILKVKSVGISDIYRWGCNIQPTEYPSTHLPSSNMEENDPIAPDKFPFVSWFSLSWNNADLVLWLG